MKRIWAPWRNTYIKNIQKECDCFFCKMIQEEADEKNLILFRGNQVFVVLNKFPYTNGHLMIVPYAHVANLTKLPPETKLELMELSTKSIDWLKSAMNPEGFNLGINLGKIAGAGLEGHIHMHVVPRWNGDSNFMTTLGETRIISESLESCYQSIKKVIER